MIDKTQVGKRIALLRKRCGMSQAALAERLDISTQAVSKWECGQALPDVDILLELSWLFEMSVNALLGVREPLAGSCSEDPATLPPDARKLLGKEGDQRILAAVASYYTQAEVCELAQRIASNEFAISCTLSVETPEKRNDIPVPLDTLSEGTLFELAPAVAEALGTVAGGVDRGMRRVLGLLRCPHCYAPLELSFGESGRASVVCTSGHTFPIVDGVVDFGSREIKGELWSLWLKNYEHYLGEHDARYVNPNYLRGKPAGEILWQEIEKLKPKVILDVASGAGCGVEFYLPRIHWSCVVIMTDLSHRILKWDRRYFAETYANPYVDTAYLACDCASIPLLDGSVDAVTSYAGFESMQAKRLAGFREGQRILRPGGSAVYTMCVAEGDENTAKWLRLMQNDLLDDTLDDEQLRELTPDREQWLQKCRDTGYSSTQTVQLYGELPAPDTDHFPFENEIAQWMAGYVMVSKKG
jgi:transcriptional regulator with XRE-family HTH domain/ubiquinone/menaquinone biosynthesis C-methylase UbiE